LIQRPSAILKLHFEFRIFVIVLVYFILAYKISSRSDGISLKCGEITIFKMVIVRHLGFPNFENFHIWPSFNLGCCITIQNSV